MTKEQLMNEIVVEMAHFVNGEQMVILRNVLLKKFEGIEISAPMLPATMEQNNEYFLSMFAVLKGNKLSKRTMEVYMSTIKDFLCVVNKPLTKITTIDIEYYLNIKSRTCGEKSLNNYKRYLSAFFTWMRKKKFITDNPTDDVEPYKEVQKPIDHLESVEKEQLKTGCRKPRDRALIEFLRCTAVRVGELISIKVSDVDFASGKVNVYGEKTKKYRTVFIDEVAKRYLIDYLESREPSIYLFSNGRTGGQLTISAVTKALHKIGNQAGMTRRVYTHLFRHTVATDIVRKGGSMSDAGEYLGHKEQSVTGKHYTFIDDNHTKCIFEKYVQAV